MTYFVFAAASLAFTVWNVFALADSPRCLLHFGLAVASGAVLSIVLVFWAFSSLSVSARREWPNACRSSRGIVPDGRRRYCPPPPTG